jgi:putative transposase
MDNGAEFTPHAFTEWCEGRKIDVYYIEPGKLRQNAFIERFNRTYREEVLDAHLFESLEQVHEITASWIPEYNKERPHDSLGRVPSLTFKPRQTSGESTLALYA